MNSEITETWADAPGFPGYQVSDCDCSLAVNLLNFLKELSLRLPVGP